MTRSQQPPTERQYEQERPGPEGEPPRPATEPKGAEDSTKTNKTATDPGSGEPSKP